MAPQQRLVPRQSQRLSLTPGMRLSLSILRLPLDTLLDDIRREADDNPFFEVHLPRAVPADAFATVAQGPDSLPVSLAHQIARMNLPRETRVAAQAILSELRSDGYLDADLRDLAAEYGLTLADLRAGLMAVQSCEPAGVGARDLAECLALQLRDHDVPEALARGLAARAEDVAEGRWSKLARALKLAPGEAERLGAILRDLPHSPVRLPEAVIVPRIPEILVDTGPQGELTVRLNPDAFPRLSLLPVARDSLDQPEALALYDRAVALGGALRSRGETVLRIARHIVEGQPRFFLNHEESLQPESRVEAAAALGLHPTTLGRAVASKSLMARGKVYDFSVFFSRALPAVGGTVSAFDVQRRIRALIAAEDRASPLADDQICDQLNHEGVDISRRTVAKYRKCLRIPSSFERRRRSLSVKGSAHP